MHYAALKEELDALPQLPTTERVSEEAANLAFQLRRKGCTIPLIDVLIAAFAITHSCILAHHDRHYELIREALPACSLKTLVMPPFVEYNGQTFKNYWLRSCSKHIPASNRSQL